ncbi:hypothetical protein FPOAC2_07142 [Fusarium poae]|uniref:Aminoglycoside phosphotransferase domain-containing protein n=1 Tax=Fusarium poae TaxID=36050 RepID=A0A1B8AZE8_FUSPO|nr:hypothetical protein FPOAC1_007000 [Fusarium poae]KAG8673685.1 hypothetical protein FPOAC1_007000 [Fusarium poae]OBS25867.1 hypothetical protein FPOA_06401 [Fusarium poae]
MYKQAPSQRWTSYDGWNWNGFQERLESFIPTLDMVMLQHHAELLIGQKCRVSEPFSAGQYSVCFELVAEDDSLIIARVRLPRHPAASSNMTEEDEQYQVTCELATMRLLAQRLPQLKIPSVYAYEGPGSQRALEFGAPYMLIQGFYGNALQDLVYDHATGCVSTGFYALSAAEQEQLITQWTAVQAMLATVTSSQIGSICDVTESGEPVIGRISSAAMNNMFPQGPFQNAAEYFTALAMGVLRESSEYDGIQEQPELLTLGAIVFLDIVRNTPLFESHGPYHLNHMDLHVGNILVDDDLNFMAIIDWEFAQTAPWQVTSYPRLFQLRPSDDTLEKVLNDPKHIRYKDAKLQDDARQLYSEKFDEAAAKYGGGSNPYGSYTEVLNGAASRIYEAFMELGHVPEQDQHLIDEMVLLAFGVDDGTNWYLKNLDNRWRADNSFRLSHMS